MARNEVAENIISAVGVPMSALPNGVSAAAKKLGEGGRGYNSTGVTEWSSTVKMPRTQERPERKEESVCSEERERSVQRDWK